MPDAAEHIEMMVTAAVRALADDQEALRRLALSELKWLTEDDLVELTGFSKDTIDKWRDEGWIRLFKPGDSREWRTTLKLWKEGERILIEAGLLDSDGRKRTLNERRRRISALRRNRQAGYRNRKEGRKNLP